MKELLSAIQTQLQTDLFYIRKGDVFITPDENYLPAHVRFPCVGLKDGDIVRTRDAFGSVNVKLNVTLIAYVQLAKETASVMGDEASAQKGVLDVIADIRASLDEDTLSISGMTDVFSSKESASGMYGNENETVQRKTISYEYEKEE